MQPELGGTDANRKVLHDHLGNYELAVKDYPIALRPDPEFTEGVHWLIRFSKTHPESPLELRNAPHTSWLN